MISTLKVLNTVTSLGTDVSVGADGILNIANGAVADAYNVTNVTINTSVSEIAGVISITPTSVASTVYSFYISGFSKSTTLPKTINVSITSAPSTSATLISDQARAIINADNDFSVVATGSSTIVLTSTTGFPLFTVGGTSAAITSNSGSTATIANNLSATNTGGAGVGTSGRIGAGLGSSLQAKYAYAAAGNALIYSELANLTLSSYYTEVVIDYLGTGYSGSSGFRGEVSTNQAVVLVLFGANPQSAGNHTDATTLNYVDLLGIHGTITGLQAGYRVSISSPATTTAAVTVTTGAIALSGGSTTFASLGGVSGDYIAIGATLTANTLDVTKVTGITGVAAGFGTNINAVSAATFKYAAWRPLPL
jgi:hypothetical protein